MTDQREPVDSDEFVKRVAALFDAIGPETEEELDATLRALGLDPKEIGARGRRVAETAIAQSPHNWRQRAPAALEEARKKIDTPNRRGPINRADVTVAIQGLVGRLGKQATAHYRNLEEASDSDLADLLDELQLLVSARKSQTDQDEP